MGNIEKKMNNLKVKVVKSNNRYFDDNIKKEIEGKVFDVRQLNFDENGNLYSVGFFNKDAKYFRADDMVVLLMSRDIADLYGE